MHYNFEYLIFKYFTMDVIPKKILDFFYYLTASIISALYASFKKGTKMLI